MTYKSKPSIKERLEECVDELLTMGILLPEAAEQFEKLFMVRALDETDGSIKDAARLLGIHRNTLSKKIRKYEIKRE